MARDIEEIRKLLPVGYPYLMIDRIIEEDDESVVAIKNVTIDEPYFQGHFRQPGPAVMPGTLILEAMAQTAAFLLCRDEPLTGYLVAVDNARFRRKVVPGDRLILSAEAVRQKKGLLKARVAATVEEEEAATATLSLLGAS